MQRLEVSGAVRPKYGSLGVKRLMLCREIIAVCSEIQNKTHKYAMWAACRIFER